MAWHDTLKSEAFCSNPSSEQATNLWYSELAVRHGTHLWQLHRQLHAARGSGIISFHFQLVLWLLRLRVRGGNDLDQTLTYVLGGPANHLSLHVLILALWLQRDLLQQGGWGLADCRNEQRALTRAVLESWTRKDLGWREKLIITSAASILRMHNLFAPELCWFRLGCWATAGSRAAGTDHSGCFSESYWPHCTPRTALDHTAAGQSSELTCRLLRPPCCFSQVLQGSAPSPTLCYNLEGKKTVCVINHWLLICIHSES